MTKKVLILGVIAIMFSLGSCVNKYNAIIYSETNAWFNDDFLKENLTRGSHYIDDDGEIVVTDETYPEFFTFIITTQEEFNSTFTEFPPTINFEKEMILVYIFTTTSSNTFKISRVSLDDQMLNIDFKEKKSRGIKDDLTSPIQKCLIVKVDKMEITAAKFTKI